MRGNDQHQDMSNKGRKKTKYERVSKTVKSRGRVTLIPFNIVQGLRVNMK